MRLPRHLTIASVTLGILHRWWVPLFRYGWFVRMAHPRWNLTEQPSIACYLVMVGGQLKDGLVYLVARPAPDVIIPTGF